MVANRFLTYRIQNIPSHFTEADLKECFHSDDKKYVEVKSLVPDVNNYDGTGTLVATILFSAPEPREPRIDDEDLDIDRDFLGFTPLNKATDDVCADIIAITGLAGHAFGSWAHSAQKMWLRDYLPKDVQDRARILIYGYESQLRGPHVAMSIFPGYGTSFIQSLVDIRDHPSCRDRPLILIGHSLGGLIIKQAITDLKPSIRSRLPVRALLFFGAPHNGLEIKALETLVRGQPTQTLISQLKPDSLTLNCLADRFSCIIYNMSIHSYYESHPTRTVALTSDDQWDRCGEFRVMVEKSSALLNHKQEETRMKVDGDHEDIARLRRSQGGVYPNVLRIIKDALQSASELFAAAAAAEHLAESGSLGGPRGESRQSESRNIETPPRDLPDPNDDDETDNGLRDLPNPNDSNDGEPDKGWRDLPNPNDSDDGEPDDEYVEDGLFCYACYDDIARDGTHFHCFICDRGNFNLCGSCRRSGTSCPGKHELIKRKLPPRKASHRAQKDEFWSKLQHDELSCEGCGKIFPQSQIHFHCIICADGDYDLCLSCKKSGRACPGRHKMYKRQIPITSPTTGDRHVGKPADPPLRSNPDRLFCRVCRKSFNSRNSLFEHLEMADHMSDETYPLDYLSCRVCRKSFDYRNDLFAHLRNSKHMVD